jgi:uncharacterized repeat protein (TIGR01451 family)
MTKARAFTIAGLIHLVVATLLATTLLFGGPSSAVGSEMIITDTPTTATVITSPPPPPTTPPPPPECHLTCTKTANPAEVLPGHTVTFDIQVRNLGDKKCRDVRVSDDLPGQLEVVSDPAGIVGNNYTIAKLSPGEYTDLTIEARVRDDVKLCTQFTNVVTINDNVTCQVALTVPCPLPPSGETAVQRGKVAWQMVVVGLLVLGVGLVATGLALRARSRV